jgi:hypothetical protein
MALAHPTGSRPVYTASSSPSSYRDDENTPWALAFAADVAQLRSEGVSYQDSADFLRNS